MKRFTRLIAAVLVGLVIGSGWAAAFAHLAPLVAKHGPDDMRMPLWWDALSIIAAALQYVVPGVVAGYVARTSPLIAGGFTGFLLAVLLNTHGGVTYLSMMWSISRDASQWVLVLATGIACATVAACAATLGCYLRSNKSLERTRER